MFKESPASKEPSIDLHLNIQNTTLHKCGMLKVCSYYIHAYKCQTLVNFFHI